jgi:GTP-binding protein HflX
MHTPKKAIVIGMIDDHIDSLKQESSLAEAVQLLETFGAKTEAVLTQHMRHRTGATFIGSGKAEEIKTLVDAQEIEIVVVNHHLKASQLFALKTLIYAEAPGEVWDRTQLILHIFSKHAHTAEAKLQIELARLKSRGPELSGAGLGMSQQGGGIGTRGIGETQSEIMRRHWRGEIKTIEAKLAKVNENRQRQMQQRKKLRLPTVSIIGYTNAGKTSLFNVLSKKEDKVQDALFATLDSSVSSLFLPGLGKNVFISDTIGFIQDLPTTLIDAFQSTLLETVHADMLLHVVDASDPDVHLKIATVQEILAQMQVNEIPQILVFNKQDVLSKETKELLNVSYKEMKSLFVSAKENQGIEELIQLIESELISLGVKKANFLTSINIG